MTLNQVNHVAAQTDAVLDGRDYSNWSPVIGGWHQWFAAASIII